MIVIFSGLPGSGKTLKLAVTCVKILKRNKKFYEKTKVRRVLYSNIHFSTDVQDFFHGFIEYWSDPSSLPALRDCDVIWDEIATHLDSTQWQNTSLELKRWLQQHRKFGVEIYGTTQDFAMIDKSMRRLTSDLQYISKLFGSSDISATRPKVKFVWGLSIIKTLDPTKYDEEKSKFESASFIPHVLFITQERVDVFNTREEIKMGKYPPLKHIERDCERDNCPFHKVVHA